MSIFGGISRPCWGLLLLDLLLGISGRSILNLMLGTWVSCSLIGPMISSLCCLNDAPKRPCSHFSLRSFSARSSSQTLQAICQVTLPFHIMWDF